MDGEFEDTACMSFTIILRCCVHSILCCCSFRSNIGMSPSGFNALTHTDDFVKSWADLLKSSPELQRQIVVGDFKTGAREFLPQMALELDRNGGIADGDSNLDYLLQ